jgi:hypothetical protein
MEGQDVLLATFDNKPQGSEEEGLPDLVPAYDGVEKDVVYGFALFNKATNAFESVLTRVLEINMPLVEPRIEGQPAGPWVTHTASRVTYVDHMCDFQMHAWNVVQPTSAAGWFSN